MVMKVTTEKTAPSEDDIKKDEYRERIARWLAENDEEQQALILIRLERKTLDELHEYVEQNRIP